MNKEFLLSSAPTQFASSSPAIVVYMQSGSLIAPRFSLTVQDSSGDYKALGAALSRSEVLENLEAHFGHSVFHELEDQSINANVFVNHAKLQASMSEYAFDEAIAELKSKVIHLHVDFLREYGCIVKSKKLNAYQPLNYRVFSHWRVQSTVILPDGSEAKLVGEYTPDLLIDNGWFIQIRALSNSLNKYRTQVEPVRQALARMASSNGITLEDRMLLS